ncbi:MAG: nucleotidyltransferase family protein [Oscillospiraceae bacterium]|nr:nucleotidyltransferase family protein [Oscillospiraceae bacterium]
MKKVGIVCEYNPLHKGHVKQFQIIRSLLGEDTAIICLMSGNFVQRGMPAIMDKSLRAKAAILCGADLVLELPVTCALSSAEGFAAGGVEILGNFCDYLCFGSESGDAKSLTDTAQALLSDSFPPLLREYLDTGMSFPAARQAALEAMGLDGDLLSLPNNILAVEYCKAILSQNVPMQPLPIIREGSYHAEMPDADNPSATAVRNLMQQNLDWNPYVAPAAADVFADAPLHTLQAGERAILGRLRTMTDAEFKALPYGSEGLWRKFMHACRSYATLEEIIAATKSKRYTRTRIDRMVMCAFLGISAETLAEPAPYTRVLAFNDTGRAVLKEAKKAGTFLNAGESADHPYWDLEKRCGDLYGLFCTDSIAAPGVEESRRVYYHKENP